MPSMGTDGKHHAYTHKHVPTDSHRIGYSHCEHFAPMRHHGTELTPGFRDGPSRNCSASRTVRSVWPLGCCRCKRSAVHAEQSKPRTLLCGVRTEASSWECGPSLPLVASYGLLIAFGADPRCGISPLQPNAKIGVDDCTNDSVW